MADETREPGELEIRNSIVNAQGAEEEEQGFLASAWDSTGGALGRALGITEPEDPDEPKQSEEEEEKSKSIEFQEQCFLLANITRIVKMGKGDKKLPYVDGAGNASLILDGSSFGFMNVLTQNPNQGVFFNMKTSDIGHLQPMVRLFKVTQVGTESAEVEQEISFDSHLTPGDVTNFFNDKGARGHGVGIKDFTFSFEADNPFAIKKSIKAKLTLFANSFEELLKDRQAIDGSGVYKYIELALKTGGSNTAEIAKRMNPNITGVAIDNLAKLNFRLKAVVGWADPIGNLDSFGSGLGYEEDGISKNSLKDAIYDSFITLNLTPTVHEFNVDQYGRVEFVLSYLAYAEDFFDQPSFNIFTHPYVGANIIKRKLELKAYNKECNAEEVGKLKEKMQQENVLVADKELALKTLLWNMLGTGKVKSKIYYIAIPNKSISKFNSLGPFYKLEDPELRLVAGTTPLEAGDDTALRGEVTKSLNEDFKKKEEGEEEEEEAAEAEKEPADLMENTNVAFFYASALFDVIMEGIEKNLSPTGKLAETLDGISTLSAGDLAEEKANMAKFYTQFQKFRLLLGPLEIVDPKNDSVVTGISLGDIPVSVRYFQEWLTKKLLKKSQAEYTLAKFANDFFNDLMRSFLNNDTCFQGSTKQKARLQQGAITSYRSGEHDEITEQMVAAGTTRLNAMAMGQPILNVSGLRGLPVSNPGGALENHFLTFFAGRVQPSSLMQGSRKSDEKRGLFHYSLGKDSGIVKTINLKRTDSPGLTEYRFEQEGYAGLEQLRYVYDVDIDSYANVNAFPGSYIYVEPRGFSPSTSIDLTKLGIGGYCMIIRSEHSFGPGKADTKISAKWVADMGGTITSDPSTPEAEVDEEPKPSPAKCTA